MRSFRTPGSGLSLRVLEWLPDASPSRETVLLLHGFMDAAATWDLVAPALAARGHRVLAPDLRGFGESEWIASSPGGAYYHFPDYVADVARIVADHVQTALIVVGHSMGGTVSTLYAGARPERVSKLALLEGVGPPDHPFEAAPIRMRRWLEDLARHGSRPVASAMTEDEAFTRLRTNHARVPEELLRSRLVHLTKRARGDASKLEWCFDPLHRTTSPMPFFAEAFAAFARKVECPVLYVSGGALGFRPPDEATRVAAFARASHVDLEGAGHMMHWTAPTDVVRELTRFFDA